MKEINYKPHPIYTHLICYEDGRIFNSDTGKFMSSTPNKRTNYIRISIKRKFLRFAHRIIYEAFNGEIEKDMQINHINGVKFDNRLCNIELVTASENIQHALSSGLFKNVGENNCLSKLKKENIEEIFSMKNSGLKAKYIAEKLGVSSTVIYNILNKKTWVYV